jgi:hypothetical protein
VLLANGGEGVDIARPAARLVQEYLSRQQPALSPPSSAPGTSGLLTMAPGVYRPITPSNTLTRPYQELLGLSRVKAGEGKLVMGGHDYFANGLGIFRRDDREAPSLAIVESDGRTYRLSSFNAAVKEPAWRVAIIGLVLTLLALGGVLGVVLSPVWLIAAFRGRLRERGGAGVRFIPVLAFIALLMTFALPFGYLASGAIPEALRLARPGPYAYAIFALSLLYPALALAGLWRASTTRGAGAFVRLHAALLSLAVLAFSAYAAAIGWVGARTWTM